MAARISAPAIAIVVLGLAGILALQMRGGPSGSAVPSAPSPVPPSERPASAPVPTATVLASPTVEPAPAWITDLEGQLDCEGPMNQMGQEVPAEVGPFDPAPTPQRALESLLEFGLYAWLPASGFESPRVEGRWAQYRYLVDGALKVIAVSTNRFPDVPDEVGWEVVGLRACDPSEFDPGDGVTDGSTFWLDANGARLRAARIFSRPGPDHCGWEAVTFLEFEGKQYLRDVKGVLDYTTDRPFRKVDALPTDAVDTGLHTAAQRLFTVPDERVVYVRSKDGTIERWGRATEPIGCM